ncbi:MAG: hypothetical protein Tsb0032_09000 [Kiloniellaceae bacterium]
MPELQRIASVLPDGTFNYNVMRNGIRLLGEAIEARGLAHVTLDGNDSGFQRDLLRHLADPATAVYLGHRFYDMGLVFSEGAGHVRRNLFEVMDRPVFAMLQDHPFSRFMWQRIQFASATTHFVAPTPEFEAEARFVNPRLSHFHTVSEAATEPAPAEAEVKPLAERPIDVFMSCSFNHTTPTVEELRQRHVAAGSPLVRVIDEVLESGIVERDRPILQLFLGAYERHFGTPFTVSNPMTQEDLGVMLVLSCLDLRIRLERRLKVVRALARLDPDLRMVVTLPPAARGQVPGLTDRRNIELIDRVPAQRARHYYLDAKFAINVTPTYLTYVTERLSNAMTLGCCVISDKNRYLAELFPESEEILFMDDCDPAALAPYFRADLDKAQAIADRARRTRTGYFAVDNLAGDLIGVMRQVL